jgi:hypothetical protein
MTRSCYDLLVDALYRALPPDLRRPQIVLCDRDEHGGFARFAGFGIVRRRFVDASQQDKPCQSTLILGLLAAPVRGRSERENELAELLRWPGAVYLQYGFTTDDLVAAARRALEGSNASWRTGILPSAPNVLRIVLEVGHWLENRLRNTQGTSVDFRNAAISGTPLHPAHLEPMAAISPSHRQMLDQLWELRETAERLAPETGGTTPLKTAITNFEASWETVEVVRAEIRSAGAKECAGLLTKAVLEFERACLALKEAVGLARRLSKEISEPRGH